MKTPPPELGLADGSDGKGIQGRCKWASYQFTPLRIVLIYAVVGGLWIFFSDRILGENYGAPPKVTLLSMIKGLGFIVVTATMLYFLIRHDLMNLGRFSESLRQSEERYRRLIETAEEGIWIIDADDRTVFVNSKLCSMLGYSDEEMLGKSPADFAGTGWREKAKTHVEQRRQGVKDHYDFRLRCKNGDDLWVMIAANPITDSDGQYAGTLGMISDISERKRAEEELSRSEERYRLLAESLRKSEARFRAIFDEAGIGIALLDREGKIVQSNPALHALLDHSGEELNGLSFQQITHSDDLERSERRYRQMLAGEIVGMQMEKRYVRKTGEVIWARSTTSTIRNCDGQVEFVVAMVEDITDRVRSQEEIRLFNEDLERRVAVRTAELAEANQSLEAFSYSVSHALRIPLEGMKCLLQSLLERDGKRLSEQSQEDVRRLVAIIARMERHIQDILDYSRVSNVEIKPERINLILVVTQVLGQLSGVVEREKAEVIIQEPLPAVWGYRPALVQVIQNLLTNALGFVAPGVTPQIRIWSTECEGCIRMWVQDNGIGIAPENHDRIFRVFERLNEEPNYPGTGIGLAIVRKGVERMGGRVGVESELGKGSRFWIELPKAE